MIAYGHFDWLAEDGVIFVQVPELIDTFRAHYRWTIWGRVAKNTWRRFNYIHALQATGLRLRDTRQAIMADTEASVQAVAEMLVNHNIGIKPIVRKNRFNSGKDRYAKKVGKWWVYNILEWSNVPKGAQ